MEKKHNIAAFAVRNADGSLREAGVIEFKELTNAIQTTIRTLKQEAAQAMMKDKPAGSYRIVDDFTGGLIEIFTGEMHIDYDALTTSIDTLREQFDVPLCEACVKEAKKMKEVVSIALKPNPTRS